MKWGRLVTARMFPGLPPAGDAYEIVDMKESVLGSSGVERIIVRTQPLRLREKVGAINVRSFDAEGLIDNAVDPRPLVPREIPAETDSGRGTRKTVSILHDPIPRGTKLNVIEPAVPPGERVSFK